MDGLDFLRTGEIGNGAGDLEDAAVGTGREFQTLHRHAQHIEAFSIGLSKIMEHALRHLGIAIDSPYPSLFREGTETLGLDITGFDHSFTDSGRRLSRLHL